jgi:hypothetical protein
MGSESKRPVLVKRVPPGFRRCGYLVKIPLASREATALAISTPLRSALFNGMSVVEVLGEPKTVVRSVTDCGGDKSGTRSDSERLHTAACFADRPAMLDRRDAGTATNDLEATFRTIQVACILRLACAPHCQLTAVPLDSSLIAVVPVTRTQNVSRERVKTSLLIPRKWLYRSKNGWLEAEIFLRHLFQRDMGVRVEERSSLTISFRERQDQ